MSELELVMASRCETGSVRQHNEDRVLTDTALGVAAVADGMGASRLGEVTALATVEHLHRIVARGSSSMTPPPRAPTPRLLEQRAKACLAELNARVIDEIRRLGVSAQGSGSTCAMWWWQPPWVVLAHVGDSRIYRLRRGQLDAMSVDHSLMHEFHALGIVPPEETAVRYGKIITRAIGLHAVAEATSVAVEGRRGDRYLLCSDGLHEPLSDTTLEALLSRGDAALAADVLLEAALPVSQDNISVVVIDLL